MITMPDYFSHYIGAEIIFERLPAAAGKAIGDKTLYLLGAQGGDVFFAYNIKPTKSNLGRALHRTDAAWLLENLSRGNATYAAGFATHYALDSVLHPAIYAYEERARSPFAHIAFENDLGLYISRKFAVPRRILPREAVLSCTGRVYDSLKNAEPLITVTGVERCLKRHFSYSRWNFRFKRQTYRCRYDFLTISARVDEAIDAGICAVQCVLRGDFDDAVFSLDFLQRE